MNVMKMSVQGRNVRQGKKCQNCIQLAGWRKIGNIFSNIGGATKDKDQHASRKIPSFLQCVLCCFVSTMTRERCSQTYINPRLRKLKLVRWMSSNKQQTGVESVIPWTDLLQFKNAGSLPPVMSFVQTSSRDSCL